jgi:hypothetical protein
MQGTSLPSLRQVIFRRVVNDTSVCIAYGWPSYNSRSAIVVVILPNLRIGSSRFPMTQSQSLFVKLAQLSSFLSGHYLNSSGLLPICYSLGRKKFAHQGPVKPWELRVNRCNGTYIRGEQTGLDPPVRLSGRPAPLFLAFLK